MFGLLLMRALLLVLVRLLLRVAIGVLMLDRVCVPTLALGVASVVVVLLLPPLLPVSVRRAGEQEGGAVVARRCGA